MSVPDPPTSFYGTAGLTQVALSWVAPGNTGSSAITNYSLQYSTDYVTWSSPPATPATPTPSTATTYTFTGLAKGTLYYFRIAAHNSSGPSIYSTTFTVTLASIPDPPTSFSGIPGATDVVLSWVAPVDDGGSPINSYILQYSIPPSAPPLWYPSPPATPTPSTATTYTFTGLTMGILYDFRIAAVNNIGNSTPYQITSVITLIHPATPVLKVSDPCDNQMCIVTWPTPYDGGSPIDYYILQYSTDGLNWLPTTPHTTLPPSQNTYTFYGLTNGTQYSFRIAAHNIVGLSSFSAPVTDTPSITPQPPSLIIATTITTSSIALSWTAPSITGGNPVTAYYIQWSEVSSPFTLNSATSSTTTYTITSLTYGTQYEIQIASINCSGTGALSDPPVYFTTSSNLPSAPTNLIITGCNTGYSNNSIILSWSPPNDDGGSAIINYIVYYRTSTPPVGTWNTYSTNSATTTAVIQVPSSNVPYDFKVAAENSTGVGVFSSTINSSAFNPPTPPTNLAATTNNNGAIILTWTASTQESPQTISYYFIEYKICEFGGWIRYIPNIPGSITYALINDPNIANNVVYLFRVYAVNSCGAQSEASNIVTAISYNNSLPTHLWSRFTINCGSNVSTATSSSTDNLDQQMLRKAGVLQYPIIGNLNFSTKKLWAMAARNQLTRKKSYATQTQDYTNANTTNMTNPTQPNIGLKQVNNSLVCWTPQPTVICNSSTASNVPGKSMALCFSSKAPYNNYRNPVTYGSGGVKSLL
jgi:Fibronectin type III domain